MVSCAKGVTGSELWFDVLRSPRARPQTPPRSRIGDAEYWIHGVLEYWSIGIVAMRLRRIVRGRRLEVVRKAKAALTAFPCQLPAHK
jgi:hypothetical protein